MEGKAERGRHLRAKGPIRVTLPAAVAYDPERLKKSLGSVLDRIGCQACCSGADILLETESEFLVDADERIRPFKSLVRQRQPADADFIVGMADSVKFDIDRVFEAVDRVIDVIGPHPCISGFDVLLQDEIRVIVVNDQLEARQLAEQF